MAFHRFNGPLTRESRMLDAGAIDTLKGARCRRAATIPSSKVPIGPTSHQRFISSAYPNSRRRCPRLENTRF